MHAGPTGGLSTTEAAERLRLEGPNELPRLHQRNMLFLAKEVLEEPMILLLLAATVLYLLFGEPRDAVLLLASVAVVIALDIYQENRAERSLQELQKLATPDVVVLRDGAPTRIPASGLVRGDVFLVSEGSRVPADAEVRSGAGLTIDESILTGESVPVPKRSADGRTAWERPGWAETPFLYAQTLVVGGQGTAEVRATGSRTEVSGIATALGTIDTATPLLRRQTRNLVWGVAMLAIILTAVVALTEWYRTGNWIVGLLAGAALAIGLLPEEIPVVLTVYSVRGSQRMVRHRALTRRFGTIPTLGAVTVLCVDKTGTLTENRMRVVSVAAPGEDSAGSEASLTAFACLASRADSLDPTDIAIVERGREAVGIRWPASALHLVHGEPFSEARMAMTHVWASDVRPGEWIVARKGAPEAILRSSPMPAEERARWEGRTRAMAESGLRVLGVAGGVVTGGSPPGGTAEVELPFLGLVGLADPLRKGVPESIEEAKRAGIRVVMITGDHPLTAKAIAGQVGLVNAGDVVTGKEIAAMDDRQFASRVATTNVFARMAPEQKLRLVVALKDQGHVVAMTGDGVNDAPALRSAHVGVAMGGRGTDVARETASLVLLDDAFPTIVEAVRTGRRVYENMRKALAYIIGVHVAIAGMALLPVLLGMPILLFPVEIVFLELIIDPTASLVFEAEPEEGDLMRRPPRDPQEPLLGARALTLSFLLGCAGLIASFAVYLVSLDMGHPINEARTLSFVTLVVSNLSIVLVNRSYSAFFLRTLVTPNRLAWVVIALGMFLLLGAIYLAPLAAIFQFVPPRPVDLLIAVLAGFLGVVWVEPFKKLLAERTRKPDPEGAQGP